ncbi:hypothetical protein INR49_000467 [Caranx melampygus]|nr:hypothetical protein INR49_000467 [Caranx melampygus]
MSLAARPSLLNSGATDRAVTWPCHSSRATDPSAFPMTAREWMKLLREMKHQTPERADELTVAHQFTTWSLGHDEVLGPVSQVLQQERNR